MSDLEAAFARHRRPHNALLAIHMVKGGDLEKGLLTLREELRLNPNEAMAHWWLASAYLYGGMLEESIDLGEADIEQRLLINARNEAVQLLTALAKQLKDYGQLVDDEERGRIEQAAGQLESARSGNDRELIARLVEQLNDLTTPFAERIMNYAIGQALEKKSIEELS